MKKTIFILLFLFLVPGVFSNAIISLETNPDTFEDTFYISKNISKSIELYTHLDYNASNLNTVRAEYDLDIYSSNLNQIDLSLSKKQEYFISEVKSNLFLNIKSLDFVDTKVRLRVKASFYDVYNNLIDFDYIYLNLVSNNSEYDFIDNPKNKVPEYKGYSLSRDRLILLHKLDTDKIIIRNHVDNSIAYGVNCFTQNQDLILDLRYLGDNQYSLEASLDQNKEDYNKIYEINCNSFYKGDFHIIKPIFVIISQYDDVIDLEVIDEIEIEEKNNLNNILIKIKTFFKKEN